MENLKRLDMNDIEQMKDLFYACHIDDAKRRVVKGLRKYINLESNIDLIKVIDNKDLFTLLSALKVESLNQEERTRLENFIKESLNPSNISSRLDAFWQMWISGMKKYYLNGDKDHVLYGYFLDDKLVAQGGYRCDLPKPWNDGWLIVYLKSDPLIKDTFGYLKIIWNQIYLDCESRGFKRWHCLIEPDRQKKFDAWYRKTLLDINDRYNYVTTLEIAKGTKPEIDWVFGALGRQPASVDFILRTGIRKVNTV